MIHYLSELSRGTTYINPNLFFGEGVKRNAYKQCSHRPDKCNDIPNDRCCLFRTQESADVLVLKRIDLIQGFFFSFG